MSDGLKPSRVEAIINQFEPVHFGIFGGWLTQILYVLVGLVPTILMVTGVVMWWYRRKQKGKAATTEAIKESVVSR